MLQMVLRSVAKPIETGHEWQCHIETRSLFECELAQATVVVDVGGVRSGYCDARLITGTGTGSGSADNVRCLGDADGQCVPLRKGLCWLRCEAHEDDDRVS